MNQLPTLAPADLNQLSLNLGKLTGRLRLGQTESMHPPKLSDGPPLLPPVAALGYQLTRTRAHLRRTDDGVWDEPGCGAEARTPGRA